MAVQRTNLLAPEGTERENIFKQDHDAKHVYLKTPVPDIVSVPFLTQAFVKMPITLQVGERRFVTAAETLKQGSGYFSSLLSGRWDNDAQADGSYFIDADHDLFEHILRYLRRGVLPLFYDKVKGHDYAVYIALLQEARYFQIAGLANWIEQKEYLQAVKTTCWAGEVECHAGLPDKIDAGVEIEFHPKLHTRKVYSCHRCSQVEACEWCGTRLYSRSNTDGGVEDRSVWKTLVIYKRVIFDQKACVEAST